MTTQQKYCIWSNEHTAWWNPDKCGYTRDRDNAGEYSKEEAEEICNSANQWIKDDGTPNEVMVRVK